MIAFRRFWWVWLLLAVVVAYAWPYWQLQVMVSPVRHTTEETRNSKVVYLPKAHALVYSLPENGRPIKIVTNAIVASTTVGQDHQAVAYQLRMQLTGTTQTSERVLHYRSRVIQYQDTQGQLYLPAFLADAKRVPTAGKVTLLRAGGAAHQLQLAWSDADADVLGILVRVYRQALTPAHKQLIEWKRLSSEQKAYKGRGNVYPLRFFREAEKKGLMQYRWQPVGPSGVQGQAFEADLLYTLKAQPGQRVAEAVLPQGQIMGPMRYVMLPLPNTLDATTIRVHKVFPKRDLAPLLLHLTHHGAQPGAPRTLSYDAPPGDVVFLPSTPGGQLALQTNVLSAVRFYRHTGEGGLLEALAPAPRVIRAWLADVDPALVYTLDHVGDQPTPIRFDVRALLQGRAELGVMQAPIGLQVMGFDAQDKRQFTIPLTLKPQVSAYDYIQGYNPDRFLSEPIRRFLMVPKAVDYLVFKAQQPVVVTVFTRPYRFPRRVRLPEDHDPMLARGERQPAWFALWPTRKQARIQQAQSVVIATQSRPPQGDADVIAGRFDWQRYEPEGDWSGRYLFMPYSSTNKIRDSALGSVFCPLQSKSQLIRLQASAHQKRVEPTLIYRRKNATVSAYQIRLDDQVVLKGRVRRRWGELRLPKQTLGSHRIEVMADGRSEDQWFINHCGAHPNNHVKRLAFRLGKSALTFWVEKTKPGVALLSGYFYAHLSRNRTHLQVEIKGLPSNSSVSEGWTFQQRLLDIQPDFSQMTAVLGSRTSVSVEQHFFVALAEDVPVGKYQVRVSLKKGTSGYFRLGQIRPGVFARHRVSIERSVFEK